MSERPPTPRRGGRLLRVLDRIAGGVALALVFVFSLVLSAAIHADLPAARRTATSLTEALLSDYFTGAAEIGAIEKLGPRGLAARDIHILDSQGNLVLQVSSLRARFELFRTLRKLISNEPRVTIVVDHIRLEGVSAEFLPAPAGAPNEYPTLIDAFIPVDLEEKPKPRKKGAKTIRVWLPTIEIARAQGHGKIAGSPTLEADIRQARGSVLVTDKGTAVDVTRFGLTFRGIGDVEAVGVGSIHVRSPGPLWGYFDGDVDGLPLHQFVRYQGDRLELRSEFPHLPPEAARAVLPEWPVQAPMVAAIEAQGTVDRLETKLTAAAGDTSVVARGPVQLSPEVTANLDVQVTGFDARLFAPEAPRTSVDAEGKVQLAAKDRGVSVDAEAKTRPTSIGDFPVPAADLEAVYDETGVRVSTTLHEPGAPTKATLHRTPNGDLRLRATVEKTDLSKSPRLREMFGAQGTVGAEIEAELRGQEVDASAKISASGFRWQGLSLDQAEFSATGRGRVDHADELRVDATLDAKGVSYGELKLATLKSTAKGPVTAPHFEVQAAQADNTQLEAHSDIDVPGRAISDARFVVAQGAATLEGKVDSASFGKDEVQVRGLVIQSGGRVEADFSVGRRTATISAKGKGVDLNRFADALGLPTNVLSGTLDVDADLKLGPTSQGTAELRVQDGSLLSVAGVDIDAKVKFDGQKTRGSFSGGVQGLARAEARWNLKLDGSPLQLRTLEAATGQAQFGIEKVDLTTAAQLFGGALGVSKASGQGYARVSLARANPNQLPQALFLAGTQNLAVEFSKKGKKKKATRIDDMDFSVAGGFDGPSGKVDAMARVFDRKGDVVSLSGVAKTDFDALVNGLVQGRDIGPSLAETEVRAVAIFPRRKVRDLPRLIRPEDVAGSFGGRAVVTGQLRDPTVNVTLSARDLAGEKTGLALPLDVESSVRYVKGSGKLQGSVRVERSANRIGWATFDVVLPWQHLVGPPPPKKPLWTGNVQVLLDGSPLEVLAPVAQARVRGSAQGSVAVSRKGWAPEVRADVTLRYLDVGGVSVGDGHVVAESKEQELLLRARFEDEFGTLTTSGQVAFTPTPEAATWDPSKPVHVTLESTKYNAVVLEPFVRDLFSELSGSLDGRLRATITPPKPGSDEKAAASFSGKITLSDGIAEPSALGLRLLDCNLVMDARREGGLNVVYLKDIHARADSEDKNVKGSGTLYFENLELIRGEFEIAADETPVMRGGLKVADLTGAARARFELEEEEMKTDIDLVKLTARLPDTGGDRTLIELEQNPDIDVVEALGPPDETPQGEKEVGTPWNLSVNLGEEVRVKSRMMNLGLRGNPQVRIAEKTRVTGSIELVPEGTVTVLGREFRIDEGNIQFDTRDPSNPHLDVTASWTASNGTVVHANLGGTVEKPKLHWSSDPALEGGESAVISLVLGGGSQETTADSSGGLVLGSAVVNELLGQAGVSRVRFYAARETQGEGRVAALSETTWDSYTAAYQVSEDLWFEGSFKTESSGFAAESRQGVAGALDWRFHRNWSLRTEVGQLGVGFDLLWQYQY